MTNYQSTFSGTYLRVDAGLTFATEILIRQNRVVRQIALAILAYE